MGEEVSRWHSGRRTWDTDSYIVDNTDEGRGVKVYPYKLEKYTTNGMMASECLVPNSGSAFLRYKISCPLCLAASPTKCKTEYGKVLLQFLSALKVFRFDQKCRTQF